MTSDFKVYLGAIEIQIVGIQYEIGLRKEEEHGLRGLWACLACNSSGETDDLMPTESEAIELAKLELSAHHAKHHPPQHAPQRKKPR